MKPNKPQQITLFGKKINTLDYRKHLVKTIHFQGVNLNLLNLFLYHVKD